MEQVRVLIKLEVGKRIAIFCEQVKDLSVVRKPN